MSYLVHFEVCSSWGPDSFLLCLAVSWSQDINATKRQYPLPRNVGAGARLIGRQPWSFVHSRHLAAGMHRALALGTSGLCWRGVEHGTVTDNGLLGCGDQQSPPRKLSPGGSENESGGCVLGRRNSVY